MGVVLKWMIATDHNMDHTHWIYHQHPAADNKISYFQLETYKYLSGAASRTLERIAKTFKNRNVKLSHEIILGH